MCVCFLLMFCFVYVVVCFCVFCCVCLFGKGDENGKVGKGIGNEEMKVKKEMIDQIPNRKLGDVNDIVNAVKFLVDSPFVNGASIQIDGGANV